MSLYGWWNLVWLLAWAKFPIPGSGSHMFCCEFCCWPFAQTLKSAEAKFERDTVRCVWKFTKAPKIILAFKSHGLVGNSTWATEVHLMSQLEMFGLRAGPLVPLCFRTWGFDCIYWWQTGYKWFFPFLPHFVPSHMHSSCASFWAMQWADLGAVWG